MHKERGERRVFLPEFVKLVAGLDVTVLLEEGYGAELGIPPREYEGSGLRIRFEDRRRVFAADLVVVLRSPEREEFPLLQSGSCLLSMLHFPTRSWRVEELSRSGVNAVSIDLLTDDLGRRVVENLRSVAWNALEAAFDVLATTLPGLRPPGGGPVAVVVMGTGEVGRLAVDAAVKFGSLERRQALMESAHPGAVCTSLGRTVTGNPDVMRTILSGCDILVDATYRTDSSRPVVPNAWLEWLPPHAVIADLAVDPYLPHDDPPVVRSIEGIPRGNLDHYVFAPDDADWTTTIPAGVPTGNRRHVVSCYSWPGIHPRECMEHYGRQLFPVVRTLVSTGYHGVSAQGDSVERAINRATLSAYRSDSTPRESSFRTSSTGTGGDLRPERPVTPSE